MRSVRENSQGKPLTDRGKLVEVWKKQAVADIFNSDLLQAAPAEKTK
jgi:hypothetical protein